MDWLTNNKDWLSVLFSLFSLLFSFFTLYRQRIKFDIYFSEYLILAEDIRVMANDPADFKSYPECFICPIHIINLSNFDIGYFSLKAFDNYSNEELNLINRNQFYHSYKDDSVVHITSKGIRNLLIPDNTHGVLKARQETYFDLVIPKHEYLKAIRFEVNIPKKSLYNYFVMSHKIEERYFKIKKTISTSHLRETQ